MAMKSVTGNRLAEHYDTDALRQIKDWAQKSADNLRREAKQWRDAASDETAQSPKCYRDADQFQNLVNALRPFIE